MRFAKLNIFILLLFFFTTHAQTTINFDNQGWSSDQSLDSAFTIGNFSFKTNQKLFTNYGYNFDVNNVSVYFVFQNRRSDRITISTINNAPVTLNSFAVYQVSEQSTDNLVVEGWNNTDKKYSLTFANDTVWKNLQLNYQDINKIVIKLDSSGNGGISDFNFDNFSFNESPLPVELTEFKASSDEDHIQIEWKTATEINNYGWEIERLKDSKIERLKDSWEEIGFVKGNGTTSAPCNYTYSDKTALNGVKYTYRLKQIDHNGDYKYSPEIEVTAKLAPAAYSLSQNYPNPFNPSTVINYQVPKPGKVVLKIYDIIGRELETLVDEYKDAGSYSVRFQAGNLASGIYIYKLIATGSSASSGGPSTSSGGPSTSSGQVYSAIKKMIVLK